MSEPFLTLAVNGFPSASPGALTDRLQALVPLRRAENVPLLKDVLASLAIDHARSQKIGTLLLHEGVLVKLGDELVLHRSALEQLRRLMATEKTKSPKIDVGRSKDLIGVTRKHAIPLLEYLDRERVTGRVGDLREIL